MRYLFGKSEPLIEALLFSAVLHVGFLREHGHNHVTPPQVFMGQSEMQIVVDLVVLPAEQEMSGIDSSEEAPAPTPLPIESAKPDVITTPAPQSTPRKPIKKQKTQKAASTMDTTPRPLAEAASQSTGSTLPAADKQVSEISAQPTYGSNPPPRYPDTSRRRAEEGIVELQVMVSASGVAETIAIARSSGFEALDQAALNAVKRWRFIPGTRNGSPIPTTILVPVRFQLKP